MKQKKQIGKTKQGRGVLGKKGDYIRNGEKLKATYTCLITQKNNFLTLNAPASQIKIRYEEREFSGRLGHHDFIAEGIR